METNLQHRSFKGFDIQAEDDYLESRKVVLYNDDVHLALAAPRQSMKGYFYKNAQADEMIYVHEGEGKLHSIYGLLPFKSGDHPEVSW